MGEQIEIDKPTLFWKSETGELKPLDVAGNIEPIEPPSNWLQEDNGSFSLSFDMTLDKTQIQNLRKMFRMRLPRKLKKRYKKVYADYFKVKPSKVRLNANI